MGGDLRRTGELFVSKKRQISNIYRRAAVECALIFFWGALELLVDIRIVGLGLNLFIESERHPNWQFYHLKSDDAAGRAE